MVRVVIPRHLNAELSDDVLKDICRLSLNEESFEREIEERSRNTGQYIKLLYSKKIKYICLSRKDTGARNSFIKQNFPTAFKSFLEEKNEQKSFEYYIRDVSTPHPASIIMDYKMFLTTGLVTFLNIDRVIPSEGAGYLDLRTPFRNYKEMRKCRFDISNRNTGNNSTVFEEDGDEISVYGKSYGANGRETPVICLALKKLEPNKKIRLYNTNETDPSHPASVDPSNKYILDYYGIEIDDSCYDLKPRSEEEKAKRDTKTYHNNLLNKFHDKKCYLCDCDIESLIIGSHIHRVTDIQNSDDDVATKQRKIVDGDNGFWLCANHDKLFEFGRIYFCGQKLVVSSSLNDEQKSFVNYITTTHNRINMVSDGSIEFKILDEHFNDNMKEYLEIHRNRVHGEIVY